MKEDINKMKKQLHDNYELLVNASNECRDVLRKMRVEMKILCEVSDERKRETAYNEHKRLYNIYRIKSQREKMLHDKWIQQLEAIQRIENSREGE